VRLGSGLRNLPTIARLVAECRRQDEEARAAEAARLAAYVPPTRSALVAELPAPGELIVRMLEARGMLAERAVGRRTVIVRVDET
jgi:hypothetical protein